ncbi:unnamed protein product, partial [Discosporangium mesarthrocarpum]
EHWGEGIDQGDAAALVRWAERLLSSFDPGPGQGQGQGPGRGYGASTLPAAALCLEMLVAATAPHVLPPRRPSAATTGSGSSASGVGPGAGREGGGGWQGRELWVRSGARAAWDYLTRVG